MIPWLVIVNSISRFRVYYTLLMRVSPKNWLMRVNTYARSVFFLCLCYEIKVKINQVRYFISLFTHATKGASTPMNPIKFIIYSNCTYD